MVANLQIDATPIQLVSDFNFLGLTIDENINWKLHKKKINGQCRPVAINCRYSAYAAGVNAPRISNTYGGVAILIRDSLVHKTRDDLKTEKSLEILWIEV